MNQRSTYTRSGLKVTTSKTPMNTIHDENKITAKIIDILSYQQSITNQGINYQGEKDWALNKIKELISNNAEYIREKTIDECIACVRGDYSDKVSYFAHNSYKLETITNLNNLKNND